VLEGIPRPRPRDFTYQVLSAGTAHSTGIDRSISTRSTQLETGEDHHVLLSLDEKASWWHGDAGNVKGRHCITDAEAYPALLYGAARELVRLELAAQYSAHVPCTSTPR
jgi:hypothetical protein